MVRGQPSLYAQVHLNAGRDSEAGPQGIRPEKEALRERCGGEHGGTQWQRFFAFADGVNQRDGFREAKAVVIVFLKQRVADAAAVAEAVVQVQDAVGDTVVVAAHFDFVQGGVADILPAQAEDAAIAVMDMQAIAVGGAQNARCGGAGSAIFPHDDKDDEHAECDTTGDKEGIEGIEQGGGRRIVPLFWPLQEGGQEIRYRSQHTQGMQVNQTVKSVAVAPFVPAVIKVGRRDDGLEQQRTTAQVTLRRGDNVVVIGVIQIAAAVADGFALPWLQ